MQFIVNATWLLAGALWAIAGFYLWVPAVLFAAVRFAFVVPVAVLARKEQYIAWGHHQLRLALSFYSAGFSRIGEFKRQVHMDEQEGDVSDFFDSCMGILLKGVAYFILATIVWALLIIFGLPAITLLWAGIV